MIIGETKIFIDLIKLGEMEFDAILGRIGCPLIAHMWIVMGRE